MSDKDAMIILARYVACETAYNKTDKTCKFNRTGSCMYCKYMHDDKELRTAIRHSFKKMALENSSYDKEEETDS